MIRAAATSMEEETETKIESEKNGMKISQKRPFDVR